MDLIEEKTQERYYVIISLDAEKKKNFDKKQFMLMETSGTQAIYLSIMKAIYSKPFTKEHTWYKLADTSILAQTLQIPKIQFTNHMKLK